MTEIDQEVDRDLDPFRDAVRLLSSIPGVSELTAQVIVSEIGTDMITEPLLSEEGFSESRKAAMRRMSELLHDPAPRVVCTHRPVLPAFFEQLRRDAGLHELDPDLPAGGFLVVHRDFSDGRVNVVAAELHSP